MSLPQEAIQGGVLNELTVKELAGKMHISEAAIIKNLFEHRVPRTLNQIVEVELARSIAVGMGYELI